MILGNVTVFPVAKKAFNPPDVWRQTNKEGSMKRTIHPLFVIGLAASFGLASHIAFAQLPPERTLEELKEETLKRVQEKPQRGATFPQLQTVR